MSAAKNESSKNWQLTGPWAGAYKIFGAIGVIGLAGAGFGYTQDPRRFAFSWMFAFVTVLTVALGSLFFVLVQHLTSAGWSVTVRRTAEFFALGLVVMLPLFLPVLATMNQLFPWLAEQTHEQAEPHKVGKIELIKPAYAQEHAAEPATGEAPAASTEPGAHHGPHTGPAMHGAEHRTGGHAPAAGAMEPPHEVIEKEIMRKKSGYLNRSFFLGRAAFYFLVWIFLATRFFGWSTSQDKSKDPRLTVASQRLAPVGMIAFGITLTFAAFDWIMSLDPTWFSTIFGVVIFACGTVASYAVIILATLSLRINSGPLEGAVTIEHYHDLGKLMFGFLVFWAYVSFSQFMLIWYAALPEETTFFHNRWDHDPWMNVSLAIIVFHFVVPFFWTISRHFKRNVGRLQIGAAIILVMHAVDMYWFVMPNFQLGKDGFTFHWLDIMCLLAVAGIYCAFVFHRMTQFSLVPIGDPRLQRSLRFQNA